MANWSVLKTAVANVIKANSNQEITGQLLQNVLNNIITNVGENSTFAGIATPTTNPGAPDGNVFYLATKEGTYSNFGGIHVSAGEAVILEWKGSWVKKDAGFATEEEVKSVTERTFRSAVNNNADIEILEKVSLNFEFTAKRYYDANLNPVYDENWDYSQKIDRLPYNDSGRVYVIDMKNAWGALDNGISISTVLYYDENDNIIGNEVIYGTAIKRPLMPPIECKTFAVVGNKALGSGTLYLAKWKERIAVNSLPTNYGNVSSKNEIEIDWIEGGYYGEDGSFIPANLFYTAEIDLSEHPQLYLTLRNSASVMGALIIKDLYGKIIFLSNAENFSNYPIPKIYGAKTLILSVGNNVSTVSLFTGKPRPLEFENNLFNPTQHYIANKTIIERRIASDGSYFKPDGTIVNSKNFYIEEVKFPDDYEENYYIDIPGYKDLGMGGIWFIDGNGRTIDIWSFKNKCVGLKLPKPKNCTHFWICRGNVDEHKIYSGVPSSFDSISISYLSNKKYTAIGDSITYQGKYINQIVAETGVSATNLGVGGMRISGENGMASSERLALIPLDSDIITISGGTNDWYQEVPLGDDSDETLDTFKGAMNILVKHILTNIPKALVVVCSTTYGEMYNRHNYEWDNAYTNRLGLTTNSYGDAMIEIAKKWNLPYVDTGRVGYNTINIRDYMVDDGGLLHPNNFGGKRIGKAIAAKLKEHFVN